MSKTEIEIDHEAKYCHSLLMLERKFWVDVYLASMNSPGRKSPSDVADEALGRLRQNWKDGTKWKVVDAGAMPE